MKKYAGMWLVLLACACGSSSKDNNASGGNNTGNANTSVNVNVNVKASVSGMMQPFPFLTSVQSTDLAYATIVLADPEQILLSPNATPTWLGKGTIDPNTCTDKGCPFSISDVDLSSLTIGMAAGVIDSRMATSPSSATLYPIFTGVAQTSVTAALASGNLNDVMAFAVRNDGFALLGNATTAGAQTLAANGALIGVALDGNLNPVAGATLTTLGYMGQVWYPAVDSNGQLTATGTTTGGPTTAAGMIIASPNTATVTLGEAWTLTTAPSSGLTWTVPSPLGTAPGFALIVPFPPNP